jgi:hypothetical protein
VLMSQPSVKDDRLETYLRSASNVMDALDRHEILGGPSAATVTLLVRYRVCFSKVLVPHLRLWYLH